MAEIQPAEGNINGGGTLILNSSEPIGTKRQRRPSVRLGDIGVDPPYDSHPRRHNKNWKLSKDSNVSGKPSKSRPLTNLNSDFNESLDGEEIGSWKVKESKKRGSGATKRVRSNWVSRIDKVGSSGGGAGVVELDEKYSGGEDVDDGYREFNAENSESPLKEQSPIHSMENLGIDGHRRSFRSRDHNDGIELSGPSENDVRIGSRENGVRIWLNGLGLGRYAPVFEVHEVDDEILPMLTLEDLKDMGINAVGSRRKLYCAIQKLVCTCTRVSRQCYKSGNGGWQSSCCTTTLSMYPLPQLPNKRHGRIGGRKLSGSVFTRLLSRLASEGHDLSIPLDLKNYWARHGTHRYITIK